MRRWRSAAEVLVCATAPYRLRRRRGEGFAAGGQPSVRRQGSGRAALGVEKIRRMPNFSPRFAWARALSVHGLAAGSRR
jgi:hypothetical protein